MSLYPFPMEGSSTIKYMIYIYIYIYICVCIYINHVKYISKNKYATKTESIWKECVECTLPKDFIRGFIDLIRLFVAEISEV